MKKFVVILLIIYLAIPVFAQDAEQISSILDKDHVSYMDFSYLVASELGMNVTPFEAWVYCDRFECFPFTAKPDDQIPVKIISYFLMKNYALSGGIMWSLTKSPRYAWKELRRNSFWNVNTDPSSVLSGRDLIQAISKFVSLWPTATLKNPQQKEVKLEFINALLADKEETL